MGFLEAMRSLSRFVDLDDPEVVAEFAWLLISAPPVSSEVAASLWTLLAAAPRSVEIWTATNRVLQAVDLEEAGRAVGEELLEHLGQCPFHCGQPAPLALARGLALGMMPSGPLRTCRFRVMSVELLERLGEACSLTVSARDRGVVFVDGRRVDETRFAWPTTADSLASLAAGAS